MIRDEPSDAVLLADDLLAMAEAAAPGATDPAERAELDEQFDVALEARRKAGAAVERQVISDRLAGFVEAMRPECSRPVPTGPTSPIARAAEREREGKILARKWGLLRDG
jgi:hypothetical protein